VVPSALTGGRIECDREAAGLVEVGRAREQQRVVAARVAELLQLAVPCRGSENVGAEPKNSSP
jgi:hypothetical protein